MDEITRNVFEEMLQKMQDREVEVMAGYRERYVKFVEACPEDKRDTPEVQAMAHLVGMGVPVAPSIRDRFGEFLGGCGCSTYPDGSPPLSCSH